MSYSKCSGVHRQIIQKLKQNEKLKTEEPQTTLQKPRVDYARQVSRELTGPTIPSDQQITANPADEEESKHSSSSQKPQNNQKFLTGVPKNRILDGRISHDANVYCSSVPTGDQSLSYIHCLPRRKSRDWSLEHITKDSSGQPKEIVQRPSIMTREDSFLLTLVRKELKSYPLNSSLWDKLLKEMKTLDPVSSGFLFQLQLSNLFQRLEIPLQLPTVKLLCQRFSRRDSPEMVNYGELLWFLKGAHSDKFQKNGTAVYSNPKKSPSQSQHGESTPPQGPALLSEVNKSLLDILKMALRTCQGKFNIENLNLSLRKEDQSFSGCLPLPKVRAICGKHGLYLTLTLLETLLNHQDLGYQGEIKWQNFVKWLSRASSDLLGDLPVGKNEKETPEDLVEILERPQSKTKHVKTPEGNLWPEKHNAMTSDPQDPVKSFKNRPASLPVLSPAMEKEAEQPELWIDRFRKLESALYTCDLSNTGVLEKERARRLIHNYNLIYNLSLSPQRIDQALKRFRSGENVILEPALRYLKEL
ncbi:Gm12695 [Phodopus roborovskii]|uniref:Gm12695 protein n=1 Tax=Phodopus roborovskii TaxID=109678 RepID=A0AAU9ZD42_PHORO|nr:Gm12695 [Phodopus roborovskii]